jgi:hypothetical protein
MSKCSQCGRPYSGLHIKGWTCMNCQIFNGEERDILLLCRRCGAPKHKDADGPEIVRLMDDYREASNALSEAILKFGK